MDKNLGLQITKKRKELKLSVVQLAKLLNLPADSIYKWQNGTNPRDFEHSKKIEKFLKGSFDEYVIAGKISKGYDYDTAIAKFYLQNPSIDFVSGIKEPVMVADALKDQLIKSQQQTIDALNNRIESLLNDIKRLSNETVVQQQEGIGKRRSA